MTQVDHLRYATLPHPELKFFMLRIRRAAADYAGKS